MSRRTDLELRHDGPMPREVWRELETGASAERWHLDILKARQKLYADHLRRHSHMSAADRKWYRAELAKVECEIAALSAANQAAE